MLRPSAPSMLRRTQLLADTGCIASSSRRQISPTCLRRRRSLRPAGRVVASFFLGRPACLPCPRARRQPSPANRPLHGLLGLQHLLIVQPLALALRQLLLSRPLARGRGRGLGSHHHELEFLTPLLGLLGLGLLGELTLLRVVGLELGRLALCTAIFFTATSAFNAIAALRALRPTAYACSRGRSRAPIASSSSQPCKKERYDAIEVGEGLAEARPRAHATPLRTAVLVNSVYIYDGISVYIGLGTISRISFNDLFIKYHSHTYTL